MINAVGERIVIQVMEPEPSKIGGLIIPSKHDFEMGKVVSIGERVGGVNVDDVVFMRHLSGFGLEYKGFKCKSVHISEILGAAQCESKE